MKTHSKSKRRVRHAAASTHRSHRPAQSHRSHVAAKSSTEIAQAGTDVSRLEEPQTKETYALVRLEVYERMKDLLYDADPWTDEEMDLLAAEDADRLGWEGMEAHQGEET